LILSKGTRKEGIPKGHASRRATSHPIGLRCPDHAHGLGHGPRLGLVLDQRVSTTTQKPTGALSRNSAPSRSSSGNSSGSSSASARCVCRPAAVQAVAKCQHDPPRSARNGFSSPGVTHAVPSAALRRSGRATRSSTHSWTTMPRDLSSSGSVDPTILSASDRFSAPTRRARTHLNGRMP
jgi:hypothetical protein